MLFLRKSGKALFLWSEMIQYRIDLQRRHEHHFGVAMTIDNPSEITRVQMPCWIAGSYLIRDMAGDVSSVCAAQGSSSLEAKKIDKSTWEIRCDPSQGPLHLSYDVYAYDLSVRLAYLDQERAFFNPGSLCLKVLDRDNEPCQIQVLKPQADARAWQLISALPSLQTDESGWGWYRACDYEELIDSPFEAGQLTVLQFQAHGISHRIVLSGVFAAFAQARLVQDVQTLCQRVMTFFDPQLRYIPFEQYTFFLHLTVNGYGGLEHRRSTALMASFDDLPYVDKGQADEAYLRLLTLFTHEYFHAWWVKWVKPSRFIHLDDQRENYTQLLWIFEGFTSYYDDLLTHRAGLMSPEAYAKALTQALNAHAAMPARAVQSLSESSWDTWIKFYKPNANRANAVVSYYVGGALAAMLLDAQILQRTQGAKRLDDVLRLAVQEAFAAGENYQGLQEDALAGLVQRAVGLDLSGLIEAISQSCQRPDYEAALNILGFDCQKVALPVLRSRLGVTVNTQDRTITVTQVLSGSAAAKAGLAGGDQLIALDGVRLDPERLNRTLERAGAGQSLRLHYFRADVLKEAQVCLPQVQDSGYEVRVSKPADK